MPAGTVRLISPDGKTEKLYPADYAAKKVEEGWTVSVGQTVGIESEYGKHYLPAEQAVGQMRGYDALGGAVPISAAEAQQDWLAEQRRQEFEGRGAEALLAGAGRGLTFGLTDVALPELGLVERDTLRGLREYEPTMSTVGELGSILVGGMGSLGSGAVAKGLRMTPAGAVSSVFAKAGQGSTARFIGANAAESALYGLSQGITNVSLSNEELAAETAVTDILKSGALGGIIGAGGAAAFKGGEKLWKAGKGAINKPPAHLDIKTPEGAEYLGTAANRLRSTMDHADEVFVKTDPLASRRMTPEEIAGFDAHDAAMVSSVDDALARASAARQEWASQLIEIPPPPKSLGGLEVPVKIDPELPVAPIAPPPPANPRIAELEEELLSAMAREFGDEVGTPAAARQLGAIRVDDAYAEAQKAIDRDAHYMKSAYGKAQRVKAKGGDYAAEREVYKEMHRRRRELGHGVKGEGVKMESTLDTMRRGVRSKMRTGHFDEFGEYIPPDPLPPMRPAQEIADELRKARKELPTGGKEYDKWAKQMEAYDKKLAAHEARVSRIQEAADKKYATAMAKYEKSRAKALDMDEQALVAYENQIRAIENRIALKGKKVEEFNAAIARMEAGAKELRKRSGNKWRWHGDNSYAAELAEDVGVIRKALGDADDEVEAFLKQTRGRFSEGEAIRERLMRPIPEGAREARRAYELAAKELADTVGDPTPQNLNKLLNGEPEEIARGISALNNYTSSLERMAATSGDDALRASTKESLDAIREHLSTGMPPEIAAAAKELDLMHLGEAAGLAQLIPIGNDGVLDDVGKTAIVYALLGGRRNLPMLGATTAAKPGKRPSQTLLGRVAASGAAGSARSKVGSQGIAGAGVRQAAGTAAHFAFGGVLNKVAGARGLYQLNGRSGSQVVQAVDRLVKKAGRKAMTGQSAAAVLKAAKWAEDVEERNEKEQDDIRELFKKRTDQIRRLAHDPQRLAQDLWEVTKEMRELHPTWGDKAEVGLGNRIGRVMQAIPQNPGGHHMFGGDSWQPDDYQIQQFANVLRVAMDPMSAVDGIVDGTLTPEAAEAFRTMAPKTFESFQLEVASRVGELRESLTYEEQNRLSMLMGVPVNVTTTQEYVQFVAQSYAQSKAKEAESMGKVDANALQQGVPTQAQQLLNRGTKR